MYDTIMKINNSIIQHGIQNDRIYLMHLDKDDVPEIVDELNHLVKVHGYTKIFAKVPATVSKYFSEDGYISEAAVPGFFNGGEDCIFMGKYMDNKRCAPRDESLNENVLKTALLKEPYQGAEFDEQNLNPEFFIRKAEFTDADKMADLYSRVFDSYPFPISDPEYIKESMKDHVVYFGIWKGNEIAALSSCEMSMKDENAEMTDFAILPEYRGFRFSYFLLSKMEKEMKNYGMKTAYTIARSCSFGMNHTFARFGYKFTGVLLKNTQIGGRIEDMNIWFKHLS